MIVRHKRTDKQYSIDPEDWAKLKELGNQKNYSIVNEGTEIVSTQPAPPLPEVQRYIDRQKKRIAIPVADPLPSDNETPETKAPEVKEETKQPFKTYTKNKHKNGN